MELAMLLFVSFWWQNREPSKNNQVDVRCLCLSLLRRLHLTDENNNQMEISGHESPLGEWGWSNVYHHLQCKKNENDFIVASDSHPWNNGT